MLTARIAAALAASALVGASAGCTTTAEAAYHEVHGVRAPNLADTTRFDLVAYDAQHATAASTNRLAIACVVPDRGVLQATVTRSLHRLGVTRRGLGIGMVFQAGVEVKQQRAVEACLRAHGASLAR